MKKVYLFIILSALLFGTMEVTLKIVGNELDAFQTTFLRFMIGGIVLFPMAINEMRRAKTKLSMKDWLYLLLLGTICVPASMTLFQLGIVYSNASTAAVIFCINPIFTVMFAHFMTKDDRFTKGKAIACIFGVAGIIMMIRPWNIQEGNTALGAILLIIASALFAFYSVLGGKSVARIGTFAQTSFSFILGSLVLFVIFIITGKPILLGVGDNIILILYLSLIVTGCGYLFYFFAIKNSNATTGSIVFFLKTVIAPVIAVIVLHETITWNMYIGIGLILIASLLIIREKKKYDKKTTDFDNLPE